MGKRSVFERRERDFYPTPREAVGPLLPHLQAETRFIEPCAGAGDLIDHLAAAGHHCMGACDIEPRRAGIGEGDALEWVRPAAVPYRAFHIITNPPWARGALHPMIQRFSDAHPTWLLFDADWSHTRQAAPLLNRLRKIVSVGRVKWIPGSKFTGKDNCAWHLFTRPSAEPCVFYGRTGLKEAA